MWKCIRDSGITPDSFMRSFENNGGLKKEKLKHDIQCAIYQNDIDLSSYHNASETLIYSSHKNYGYAVDDTVPRCLVIEQKGKKESFKLYHDATRAIVYKCIALCQSADGLYAAGAFRRKRVLRSEIEDDGIISVKIMRRSDVQTAHYQGVEGSPSDLLSFGFNEVTKEFYLCEYEEYCYPMATNMYFTQNNDVCIDTTLHQSDKKSHRWYITQQHDIIALPRMVDVGKNELVSLSATYLLPSLYNKLLPTEKLSITDERFNAALPFLYGGKEHLDKTKDTLVKDIGKYIALLWYRCDSKLQKNTKLIYGEDEALFPLNEKRALKVFSNIPIFLPDPLCMVSISDENKRSLFYLIEYIKMWGGYGKDHVSQFYVLLNSLFDKTCTFPPEARFETDVGTIIMESWGTTGLRRFVAGPKNNPMNKCYSWTPIFESFPIEYLRHYQGDWSAESAQQWIHDKTYTRCELSPDKQNITLYCNDNSTQRLHRVKKSEDSLESVWEKENT